MNKIIAGIDIGGTSVKTGLFSPDMKLIHHCPGVNTGDHTSGESLVKAMLQCVYKGLNELGLERSSLVGIGMGCPGPLDIAGGIVLETPNISYLNGYPLRAEMSKLADLPVYLDNDANVFTLGEAVAGAAVGQPYVVGVTLGTGFGWGIVLNGKLFHGATGTAAEYGLSKFTENGITWEDRVSLRGLMASFTARGGKADSPKEVSQLAADGDEYALDAWAEYGSIMGLAISHAVNLIDPHQVVIGGTMSLAWDYFAPAMLKTLRANIFSLPRETLKVSPSLLGDEAALYGAASLVESK
ncbi:ROK family protein [Candidatus Neomarinimicrobiota bacterium]